MSRARRNVNRRQEEGAFDNSVPVWLVFSLRRFGGDTLAAFRIKAKVVDMAKSTTFNMRFFSLEQLCKPRLHSTIDYAVLVLFACFEITNARPLVLEVNKLCQNLMSIHTLPKGKMHACCISFKCIL